MTLDDYLRQKAFEAADDIALRLEGLPEESKRLFIDQLIAVLRDRNQ